MPRLGAKWPASRPTASSAPLLGLAYLDYGGAPVGLGLTPYGLTLWLGPIPTVATVAIDRAAVLSTDRDRRLAQDQHLDLAGEVSRL